MASEHTYQSLHSSRPYRLSRAGWYPGTFKGHIWRDNDYAWDLHSPYLGSGEALGHVYLTVVVPLNTLQLTTAEAIHWKRGQLPAVQLSKSKRFTASHNMTDDALHNAFDRIVCLPHDRPYVYYGLPEKDCMNRTTVTEQ